MFGAASESIDRKYIEACEKMGECLANRGHKLVFGAGNSGLMGATARGFKKANADIMGVIPEFFEETRAEVIYRECTTLIYTDSMRERKAKMEDEADAFIICPGGIGTFEEFFEVLTLKQLGRHSKPIVIYNIDGYYDSMKAMMAHSISEGFLGEKIDLIYSYIDNLDEMVEYLERTDHPKLTIKELKNG